MKKKEGGAKRKDEEKKGVQEALTSFGCD